MKTRTAMIITMFGLLLTMGGVGGIEQSLDNEALVSSMLVSIVGLLMMYCGVIALRVSEYYDAR
jgi:hypothetical protein